jgi:hypothetical protein
LIVILSRKFIVQPSSSVPSAETVLEVTDLKMMEKEEQL